MRWVKFRQPLWSDGKFHSWHYWGHIESGFASPHSADLKKESQQYTGLHDKNGIEIFEGDIFAPRSNDFTPEYRGNWKIIYKEGAYFGETADGRHETWLPYWTEKEIEIIGNTYENLELMKEV